MSYAPGAGIVAITWDNISEQGDWDIATSATQLVVGVAGLYHSQFYVNRGAQTSAGLVIARLTLNGTLVATANGDSSTGSRGAGVTFLGELEIGDVLVAEKNWSGATAEALADSTRWGTTRVGPVRWT